MAGRWGQPLLDAVMGRVLSQVEDAQFRFSGVCSAETHLDAQGDRHKCSFLALVQKKKMDTKWLPTGE